MKVVSLLPSGTEIVAALGAERSLVGISHECDWPPSVGSLPRVTATPLDLNRSSGEIDRAVLALRADASPVIQVNPELLRELRPDLIITQGLCEVCAVADGVVYRLAEVLDGSPSVLSLEANDLAGIFADIHRVGAALDLESEAGELVMGLEYRLDRLKRSRPAGLPRVLCVEWLDPLYLSGHWVPDLVTMAGGADAGASSGAPSRRVDREELKRRRPDLVVVMLCGFGLSRAVRELERTPLPDLNVPVWALDGNAYTSRAGPRVVDSAALLQSAMLGQERPNLIRVI